MVVVTSEATADRPARHHNYLILSVAFTEGLCYTKGRQACVAQLAEPSTLNVRRCALDNLANIG